jgi:hypothetical protein
VPYAVDFNDVSTAGLESSPVAAALAGLRAHEARYFKNKYDHFLLQLQERLLTRTCPAFLPPHDSAIEECEARLCADTRDDERLNQIKTQRPLLGADGGAAYGLRAGVVDVG